MLMNASNSNLSKYLIRNLDWAPLCYVLSQFYNFTKGLIEKRKEKKGGCANGSIWMFTPLCL